MKDFDNALRKHNAWFREDSSGERLVLHREKISSYEIFSRGVELAVFTSCHFDALLVENTFFVSTVFSYSRFSDCEFVSSRFIDVDFSGASFKDVIFKNCDFRKVNFEGASFVRTEFIDCRLPPFQICPQEGEFIAWKKVYANGAGRVVKLLIPADAKRTSSLVGRKCRASHAFVLEGSGYSSYTSDATDFLFYKEGETVYPDAYDDDIRVECTNGIHFFMTREEAEDY